MSQECICEFCQWRGVANVGDVCPHCGEQGWLMLEDEWVLPEDRPDNKQTIYSVMQELNDDCPELETDDIPIR